MVKLQAPANVMVRLTAHAHTETKAKLRATANAITRPPVYAKAMPILCALASATVRS